MDGSAKESREWLTSKTLLSVILGNELLAEEALSCASFGEEPNLEGDSTASAVESASSAAAGAAASAALVLVERSLLYC